MINVELHAVRKRSPRSLCFYSVCTDAKISNGDVVFQIFSLGMLQKMSNIS